MDFKNKNTVAPIQKNIFNQVPSHITPESSEINDLAEKVDAKVMMNPLTKQLMEMDFDPDKAMVGLKQFFFRFFYKLSKFDPHMKAVFFVTAVFVLILMLITSKTAFSGYSLSFEIFGFSLSNTLLFFTALIAPISWFVFKYNFYIHLNGMSFLEPVVLFFSSAVCLKIYDFNSPIWNRMTSSFLWIMGSITIIHVVYPT